VSCVICGKWDCKEHVGYKGQRYEVRAQKIEGGAAFVVGWTNDADGGGAREGGVAQSFVDRRSRLRLEREERL